MNPEKRKRYAQELINNGIDTLSGTVPNRLDRIIGKKDLADNVKEKIRQFNYDGTHEQYYMKLNLNKISSHKEKLINKYCFFLEELELILRCFECDPDDLELKRVDFCFNSLDSDYFEEYSKLHRLLISCIIVSEQLADESNNYVTHSLFENDLLSIAVRTSLFEAENYNKAKQSKGKDVNKARLELRSKGKEAVANSILELFLDRWFERLERAYYSFDDVCNKYNAFLYREYIRDNAKPKREQKYTSLTNFILQNDNKIFCRQQLVKLLKKIGIQNPEKKADRYKQNHKIEYFSKTDLQFVIDTLEDKLYQYFS